MKHSFIYLGVFLLCQSFSAILVQKLIAPYFTDSGYDMVVFQIVLSVILYSIMTLAIFLGAKWCPVSNNYVASKPVGLCGIIVLLAIVLILPSAWVQELLPDQWTKDVLSEQFDKLLRCPEGYIVIGLSAPLVEEVVFRGAILRKLLEWMNESFGGLTNSKAWIAIVISAVFFAVAHLNPAQFPHALLIGTLLGWIYYRTGSIIPGILYHWVNNSTAFVLTGMFPEVKSDSHLIEYFNGNQTLLFISVAISIIVAVPCIWQLNRMMKRL